jgi:hypothetical protein
MKTRLRISLIGLVVLALSVGFAFAYTGPTFIKESSVNGIRYLTGGVGLEERSRLEAMAEDCNLKLVFALASGNYLANVAVEIEDSRGKKLIAQGSNGPWFFVKLPEGEYRVAVTHGEHKKVRRVKVGKELKTAMFHWRP